MIYSLSNINQQNIQRGASFLWQEMKKSFHDEPLGVFLNGFLAFLCVILVLLSTSHQTKNEKSFIQQPIQKVEAAERTVTTVTTVTTETTTKEVIVEKLAEEASKVSPTSNPELKENIASIIDALDRQQIATPRVIAYAMATAERETGNTFRPIEEYGGPQQAIALGYSGGERYYGRGYIQITHDYNYAKFGAEIGMGDQLLQNPELALEPRIASDIMAEFFKENGVAEKAEADFVAARGPINGYDHAETIAYEAEKYLQTIEEAK